MQIFRRRFVRRSSTGVRRIAECDVRRLAGMAPFLSRKRSDFPGGEGSSVKANVVERPDETLALQIAERVEVTTELNRVAFGKVVRECRRAGVDAVHVNGERA